MSDSSGSSRKWAGRAIQLALAIALLAYVGHWLREHVNRSVESTHVSELATPPDSLGPGDLRIYNADSTVDLILFGDKISAGLSPQMVAKVRRDLDTSKHADSGLGGSIAKLVKTTVSGAIGTHAVYNLADVRDIRYESGKLVFDWKHGGHQTMFSNTNINDHKADNSFSKADAERFIAAVNARKTELGIP
jgi:hypothetical protein